jgi:peptidoglycan/LPS O-acetylase OafA/YrhL
LLLLLLAILSALHLGGVSDFVVKAKTGGLGRALFAALTFHVNWLEATRGYLPGNWDILWSLSVEEVFYLVFPLVCVVLGRGKWLFVFLAAFVVLGPFGRTILAHNGTWKEYSYLGGMDGIALGCLAAIFSAGRRFSRNTLRALAGGGLAIMGLGLLSSTEAWKQALDRSGLYMSLLAIATCMVIMAAAQSNWRSPRILLPLAALGERSYEVYLTHMFVVFAFFDWFMAAGHPMNMVPWLFIATILVSALLGALVDRFYSEPMNAWLRKSGRREATVVQPKEAAATASR